MHACMHGLFLGDVRSCGVRVHRMATVIRVEFLTALDFEAPLDQEHHKSVCHLAPRWDVVLTLDNGHQEAVTAEYQNHGAHRDAYSLDSKRIMKLSPITQNEGDNDREVALHDRIASVNAAKVVPDVLGNGRTDVAGCTLSWLILERASWTMSDMMLHPAGLRLPWSQVAFRCSTWLALLPHNITLPSLASSVPVYPISLR